MTETLLAAFVYLCAAVVAVRPVGQGEGAAEHVLVELLEVPAGVLQQHAEPPLEGRVHLQRAEVLVEDGRGLDHGDGTSGGGAGSLEVELR